LPPPPINHHSNNDINSPSIHDRRSASLNSPRYRRRGGVTFARAVAILRQRNGDNHGHSRTRSAPRAGESARWDAAVAGRRARQEEEEG